MKTIKLYGDHRPELKQDLSGRGKLNQIIFPYELF